jgi:hypothetical protein
MRRGLPGLVSLISLVSLVMGCTVQPFVAPVVEDGSVALAGGDSLRARLIAQAEIAKARERGSKSELRLAYAQYLSVAADDVERTRRAVEYAALLLEDDAFDEAAVHLRAAVDAPELELELRVWAARMLVEAMVTLWKRSPTGEARRHAATRARDLVRDLPAQEAIWRHEAAYQLREQAPEVLAITTWDIAIEHEREGLEHGDRKAFEACANELIWLYNGVDDHPDPASVLMKAADCSSRAYRVNQQLQLLTAVVERHPHSEQAADARLTIAQTYRSVLSYREAVDHYRAFVELYPDDERATEARTLYLQLALTHGDPVVDTIEVWGAGMLDERMLAAAVEFRAARQAGDVEAMSTYLDRHRVDGGPAREIAARVALAADALRLSCPDSSRANGLCMSAAAEGRLGEVLHRNPGAKLRAEQELGKAQALMRDPAWKEDPLRAVGAPLALEPEELLELEATVALLVGDLSAEEALGVQPPRSYEASRTRIWLDERKKSVAAMITAYEQVGANDPARAAAAAERTAQVYESDATLLARVELELVQRGSTEFAHELARVEAERTAQALAAYQQCLTAIAAHGDDPAEVQQACTLGVARLCGRHQLEVAWADDSSLRTLVLGTN